MTKQAQTAFSCPRDGTPMQRMGRRGGAWRCPDCRGVFINREAMRRGRPDRPPAWLPVLASVVASILVTRLIRRLRRRGCCGPSA